MSNRDNDFHKKREQGEHNSSQESLTLNIKNSFEKAAHQVSDVLGQAQNEIILRVTGAPVATQYVASISPALASQYARGREIVLARESNGKSTVDLTDLNATQRKAVETYQRLHSDLPSKIPFYNKEILARDLDRDIVRKASSQNVSVKTDTAAPPGASEKVSSTHAAVAKAKFVPESATEKSHSQLASHSNNGQHAQATKNDKHLDSVRPASPVPTIQSETRIASKAASKTNSGIERNDNASRSTEPVKSSAKAADTIPAINVPKENLVKARDLSAPGNALISALESKPVERLAKNSSINSFSLSSSLVQTSESPAVEQRRPEQIAGKTISINTNNEQPYEQPAKSAKGIELTKQEKLRAMEAPYKVLNIDSEKLANITAKIADPSPREAKDPKVPNEPTDPKEVKDITSPNKPQFATADKNDALPPIDCADRGFSAPEVGKRDLNLRPILASQSKIIDAIELESVKVRRTIDQDLRATTACIKVRLQPELASFLRTQSLQSRDSVVEAVEKEKATKTIENVKAIIEQKEFRRSLTDKSGDFSKSATTSNPRASTKAESAHKSSAESKSKADKNAGKTYVAVVRFDHNHGFKAIDRQHHKADGLPLKPGSAANQLIGDNTIKAAGETKVSSREYKFTCSDKNQKYLSGPEIALAAIIALAGTAKLRPEASALQNESVAVIQNYNLDFIGDEPNLSDCKIKTQGKHGASTDATEPNKGTKSEKTAVLMRPKVLIGADDTLVDIAEQLFNDAGIGWLILNINDDLESLVLEGKTIVRLRSRQEIFIPVYQDIIDFQKVRTKEMTGQNLITIVEENQIDREILNIIMAPLAGASENSDPLQNWQIALPQSRERE